MSPASDIKAPTHKQRCCKAHTFQRERPTTAFSLPRAHTDVPLKTDVCHSTEPSPVGNSGQVQHDWCQHEDTIRCSSPWPTEKLTDSSRCQHGWKHSGTSRTWADGLHVVSWAVGWPSKIPAEKTGSLKGWPASHNCAHHTHYEPCTSLFGSDTDFRNVKILREVWW